MFDITDWLFRLMMRIPWLNASTVIDRLHVGAHLLTSLSWSLFFVILIRGHSKWWWMSVIPYVVFVLYEEFYLDGHLAAIRSGDWAPGERRDFYSDLITRLGGLVGYLMVLL